MPKLSTEQVAKIVGLNSATLSRYIKAGKISAPQESMAGGMRMRLWSESDIEKLKRALPKAADGRKTRYQKVREKQKVSAAVPAPHKKRRAKKKK